MVYLSSALKLFISLKNHFGTVFGFFSFAFRVAAIKRLSRISNLEKPRLISTRRDII